MKLLLLGAARDCISVIKSAGEPVCVGGGGHGACRGFRQAITVPRAGARVRVTGEHVRDLHHHWMELHPVTSVTVIP